LLCVRFFCSKALALLLSRCCCAFIAAGLAADFAVAKRTNNTIPLSQAVAFAFIRVMVVTFSDS
jgi:hypothetical protein